MNGILVVNKPYGYTSRDVVNIISKKLGTKKVGHTGTLDPIATGVLVVPIGRALKISELLTAERKEYIRGKTLKDGYYAFLIPLHEVDNNILAYVDKKVPLWIFSVCCKDAPG